MAENIVAGTAGAGSRNSSATPVDGIFIGEPVFLAQPAAGQRAAHMEEQLTLASIEVLRSALRRDPGHLSEAETTLVFHALSCADALRRALEDRP
ncbi:hypothetical protein [Pseudoxanthomonas mexicana]|jgi:hypothetical protein